MQNNELIEYYKTYFRYMNNESFRRNWPVKSKKHTIRLLEQAMSGMCIWYEGDLTEPNYCREVSSEVYTTFELEKSKRFAKNIIWC
jgi:hypothetical protein